jgi:hypothetical protein
VRSVSLGAAMRHHRGRPRARRRTRFVTPR